MKKLNPYLTFNGNCREAMKFYQKCLGGKLHFQTAGESPGSGRMSAKMKKTIIHASLTDENFVLTGSDIVEGQGLVKGNAIAISISFTSEKALRSCYKKLSYDAVQKYPVQHNFYGILFGSLTDRFGNHWLLNCLQDQ